MISYVRNIIIVGIAASLAISALPKNGNQCGKYVKYLASFLILAVILSPLGNLPGVFEGLKDAVASAVELPDESQSGTENDPVIEKTAETIAKYVLSICKNEFGIETDGARVKVILDDADKENVKLLELHIYTEESDREVLNDVEKYFGEMFDTKVFAFGP